MTIPTPGPHTPTVHDASGEAIPWQQRLDLDATELAVELWEAQGHPVRAWHTLLTHVRYGGRVTDSLLRRVGPLDQLDALGKLAPTWAHARWVLHQTLVSNAAVLRAPATTATAQSAVVGFPEARDAPPREPHRDWVRRQLLVYDLGGARLFLDHVATRRLRVMARDVESWLAAPMAGYRCVGFSDGAVTWRDLRTGRDHVVADTGSAHFTALGGTAIGRIVPCGEQVMFESIPLAVPERTALDVADDPDDWLAALDDACRFPEDDDEPFDLQHDFGVVDDVPRIWSYVVLGGFGRLDGTGASIVTATVALVRAALRDRVHRRLTWWGEEEQRLLWPTVAAALLHPAALRPLLAGELPLTESELRRLSSRLPQPAASVCDHLLRRAPAA